MFYSFSIRAEDLLKGITGKRPAVQDDDDEGHEFKKPKTGEGTGYFLKNKHVTCD